MTNIERLRLAVHDKEKVQTEEIIGVGDGVRKKWVLEMQPIIADSEVIVIDDVPTSDYDLNCNTGLVIFTTAPTNLAVIKAQVYSYYAFSDVDLTEILTEESSNILMAAARCLRTLAADAARFFVFSSGDEKVDKSKICANFLRVAQSWETKAKSIPASAAEHWKVELKDFGDLEKIDLTTYLDDEIDNS